MQEGFVVTSEEAEVCGWTQEETAGQASGLNDLNALYLFSPKPLEHHS